MAQDFRFASLRKRFKLNSPSMPNLCGPEISDKTSSIVEPNRTAEGDASEMNEMTDNNNDDDDTPNKDKDSPQTKDIAPDNTPSTKTTSSKNEHVHDASNNDNNPPNDNVDAEAAIETISQTSLTHAIPPLEEPFNTLYSYLQDQFGLNGYPRLRHRESITTTITDFSTDDEFPNETQNRICDSIHRYLNFFRQDPVLRANFSLAIPPRGVLYISPDFYHASMVRPELMSIVFRGKEIGDEEVRRFVYLNGLRASAALAIDRPHVEALPWHEKRVAEDVTDEASGSRPNSPQEELPMTFGILRKFLNLKKPPTEVQIQQLHRFMTDTMKNFTWNTTHNAKQVWQGYGQEALDIENHFQDMALENFRKRELLNHEQKDATFTIEQDELFYNDLHGYISKELWVREAVVENSKLCLDDIVRWLTATPLGLETLCMRIRWDLQTLLWKKDRLVMLNRNIQVARQAIPYEPFGRGYSQMLLQRLRRRRSPRTEAWGSADQRAQWDAEDKVLRQKTRIAMIQWGNRLGLNDGVDVPEELATALREHESLVQNETENDTPQSSESSASDQFQYDEVVPRLDGVSSSWIYSRSTADRPQSHIENNVEESEHVPSVASFTHSRSLDGSRTQFPALASIIESIRDPRPASEDTDFSFDNVFSETEPISDDLGQLTPTQNDYEPQVELQTSEAARISAVEQSFMMGQDIPPSIASRQSSLIFPRGNQNELHGARVDGSPLAVVSISDSDSQPRRASLWLATVRERKVSRSSGLWNDVNEVVATGDVASGKAPSTHLKRARDGAQDVIAEEKPTTTDNDVWSSWVSSK